VLVGGFAKRTLGVGDRECQRLALSAHARCALLRLLDGAGVGLRRGARAQLRGHAFAVIGFCRRHRRVGAGQSLTLWLDLSAQLLDRLPGALDLGWGVACREPL
jgi:hypothetical protein